MMRYTQHTADYFDALFEQNADPWQFKSRWYETRKRALTLACLPQLHYASAYEPGCANGELSAALATRCDNLLVTDGARQAVAKSTARLVDFPHVRIQQAWVPLQWPQETFDLIVLSEFNGDEVHQCLSNTIKLPCLSQLLEPDMRLDVWSNDARSVAQREGFM